jgi:isoleucyl-tRNA synthetase
MTNTRKNALHEGIKADHYNKVRDALEAWLDSGESLSVIEDEVENIVCNLQDYI